MDDFASILDDIGFFIGEIINQFGDWELESDGIIDFIERQLNPLARLRDAVDFVRRSLDEARLAWERWTGVQSAGAQAGRSAPGGRGRAQGGRVTGGSPYLVGEVGPELFVPGRGGMIIPNDRLGAGGSNITINVQAGMGANGAMIGQEIVYAIARYERSSGPVFARVYCLSLLNLVRLMG